MSGLMLLLYHRSYLTKYSYLSFLSFILLAGTTWSGTLEKLAMPGVLFHHETPTKDYIHSLLKPWVHYIPIQEDLMDLKKRYEWAESHPNEARAISDRATKLIRSLGTVEGFEKVYTEYYEKPIRQVVEAYIPLVKDKDGTSSWQELIRQSNGEAGVRPMTKCCG